MSPVIIEIGRGRLILNRVGDRCSVTVDVGGAGYTLLPDRAASLHIAGELMFLARQIKRASS